MADVVVETVLRAKRGSLSASVRGDADRAYSEAVRCIRYSHSCVRFESDGQTLVVDPGIWSEPNCVDGADAVLATHEHADHIDQQLVAATGLEVYAPAGAQLDIESVTVQIDVAFQVAGFNVEAVGGRHACVVGHQEPCVNVGYVINGVHYHPGDALHVPDGPIETLFVPLQASWLKTAEAIDFVHRVAPRRAIGIHEGQINERGLRAINHWLSKECAGVYEWLPPGTATELDRLL